MDLITFGTVIPVSGIIGIVAGVIVLPLLTVFFIVGNVVFRAVMKRKDKSVWGHECSSDIPEHVEMYNEGLAWAEQYADCKTDVRIINEGLKLYGEFFDLKSDRAVIIMPGRTEGLRYSYYYAKPYTDMGYSVLVIDQRAHGMSDGKYNSAGGREYLDVIEWVKLIKAEFGINHVILHGICIGSACAVYVGASKKCPDVIDGIVCDGMFSRFIDTFKRHMEDSKKNPFPVIYFIDFWMVFFTRTTMRKGPIDCISRCNKPLLMFQSKTDAFSDPENAQKLYDACPNVNKRLVYVEKAEHSKVRYRYKELYDGEIKEFIARL